MMTLDADMAALGRLVVLGAVRLDGRFEGTIVCSKLEIGPDGYLIGSVVTQDLVVAGQLVGNVQASRVYLSGSAILEGELNYETLRMDETATLVGDSRRQRSLEMPADYAAMSARARQADEDILNLETEARVRRAAQAGRDEVQFKALRARFPVAAKPGKAALF